MTLGRRSSAGFTLIELLVVIAITGLLLASVLAAKPRTATAQLLAASRQMAFTLEAARTEAMKANAERTVFFDADNRVFGFGRLVRTLPRGAEVAFMVADTERNGNRGQLRFYPDGQSSGGEIVITLEGKKSRISVNWLTGYPQLGS